MTWTEPRVTPCQIALQILLPFLHLLGVSGADYPGMSCVRLVPPMSTMQSHSHIRAPRAVRAGCSSCPEHARCSLRQQRRTGHRKSCRRGVTADTSPRRENRDVRGNASSSGAMVWQGGDRSNGSDTTDKRSWGIPAALRDDGPSVQTQSANPKILPINVDLLLVSRQLNLTAPTGHHGLRWSSVLKACVIQSDI